MILYKNLLSSLTNEINNKSYIGSQNFALKTEDIISLIINRDISIIK